MKIKSDGFVCKVAYFFSNSKPPERTNLCKLFWRFCLNLCLIPIVVPVLFFIVFLVFSIGYFLGFFVAYRPSIFKTDPECENGCKRDFFVKYETWPKIKGWRIYPICVIILGICIFYSKEIFGVTVLNSSFWYFLLALLSLILILVFVVALMFGMHKVLKSEAWQLFTGYFKACKQKICPVVEILPKAGESLSVSD